MRVRPEPLTQAQIRLLTAEAIEARRKGRELRVYWCDNVMYVVPLQLEPKKKA